MANITDDGNGARRLRFKDHTGKWHTVRFQDNAKNAALILSRVKAIVSAKTLNVPFDAETAVWLRDLPNELYDKLAKTGIIPHRESAILKPFIDHYVDSRRDVKPATKEVWQQGISGLVEFFGETKRLQEIKAGDADNYKQFLIGKGLAPHTVKKRLQFANTLFIAATRREVIEKNPFFGVTVKVAVTNKRKRFVTVEEISRIIAKCPNHHWRTMIALARFAGMRCPNEVLSLKWSDVDWEREEIIVTANKTAHHPGKETRICPIFADLKPYLEEAWELAEVGAVYVVDESYRKSALGKSGWRNCNLRTTFEKIVKRAGIEPWAKPFVNLRSTRETELVNAGFPQYVVASWFGHSEKIQETHYLQVTEEHHQKALVFRTKAGDSSTNPPESGISNTSKMLKSSVCLSTDNDATSYGQKTNHQEKVSLNASLSASAGGGNGVKTGEKDICTKKQQKAVTSFVCNGLRPNSGDCRIDSQFSKTGVADGEGFEPTVRSPVRRFSRPVP